jgi:hypothetical protein
VKVSDSEIEFASEPGERKLRLVKLPVRAEKSAILVGIGIADHDLLDSAPIADRTADQGYAQELAQNGGRTPQVVDGLEQRHNR